MKEVSKELTGLVVDFKLSLPAETGSYVAKTLPLVPLQTGQYYRLESLLCRVDNAMPSAAGDDGVLIRNECLIGVGKVGTLQYMEDNGDFPVYALLTAYWSGMVVINQTSASYGDLMNPISDFEWLGKKPLDSVSNSAEVQVVFGGGDIVSGSLTGEVKYSVVTLSDSERIELLSRCPC